MNTRVPIWVKICANTSLEDARLAAAAGADAVGFVFAASPRRVTTEEVAAIAPWLPTTLEKIGVFVDAALDEVCSTVRSCGLTGIQLHSRIAPQLTAQLREKLGPSVRIVRAVHFGPDTGEQVGIIAADGNVDGILVDSRTVSAAGGTGTSFDWNHARATVFGNSPGLNLIAAGGLCPDNVREAIRTLRPWGVDVASGVEAAPGRKDPIKVREFIANARAAARE